MKLLQTIGSDLNRLFIFELRDGHRIEAVHYRDDTLCVSTQVGCPVLCSFCASGQKGLLRNLSAEEIFGQYRIVSSLLPVRRIAVAGIGEPLSNWENVKKSFWLFKRDSLKVSFYTSGYPLERLSELIDLPHCGVTVSLHFLSDEKRNRFMPRSGGSRELLEFLRRKVGFLTRKKRSKISLGYILFKGLNDSEEDLRLLTEWALQLGISVTLLRYNETGGFLPADDERYEHFFRYMRRRGVKVTLSTRFRRDKIGGCGTLVVNREEAEVMI